MLDHSSNIFRLVFLLLLSNKYWTMGIQVRKDTVFLDAVAVVDLTELFSLL